MKNPALAIMAKVPSSDGKKRLGSLLTSGQREELQWAFMEDMLGKTSQVDGLTTFLAVTPEKQADKVKTKLDQEINIMAQPAGDLGVRIFSVAHQLFKQGFGPVLITGTDSPTLPPSYLGQALQMLKNQSVVFGPSMDGGYYLVGLSYPECKIFTGISWGTGQVLQQTISICQKLKLPYSLLPALGDIDWPKDLLALQKTLVQNTPSTVWFPHRTANFLRKYNFRKDGLNGNLL